MTAYYNEIDPFAAKWLRELIKAGMIAPGDVDERSIEDVRPDEIMGYDQCHFFAGIGVWSYALRQAGWPDDSKVWTGSCPCQPFSTAGQRAGFADERHLWPSLHWLVCQCRPDVLFGEQVSGKDGQAWLDVVSTDLEGEGYACGSVIAPACGFGAPHVRSRIYWVADSDSVAKRRVGGKQPEAKGKVGNKSDANGFAPCGPVNGFWAGADWVDCCDGKQRPLEPHTTALAARSINRMGKLRGFGNAIVAPQAQAFIESYMEL